MAEYIWIRREYVWIYLNMSQDVIMEGFWIFQDSEYARFLSMKGYEYAWMWLSNGLKQGSDYA